MTSELADICSWFAGVKGLAAVIIIGVAVRLALAPLLTYDFDIYHWGVILENIQTGNGLYGLAGYYYTPVWGYFMGSEGLLMGEFDSLDAYGYRYEELLPMEASSFRFHSATVTTAAFDVAMKLPLIVVDAISACLIYMLVTDLCGDKRRACAAAALWMAAPLVIYMSGVQTMFDTLNGMLMILMVMLLMRGYRFIPGALFSVAALLKFFPLFAVLVLLAYVFYAGRRDGTLGRDLVLTVSGAGIAFAAIYLPEVLDGTFVDSLSFILARAGDSDPVYVATIAVCSAIAIVGSLYFSYRMWRHPGEDLERSLLLNVTGALLCAVCMSTTPQYVIVALPLLIACSAAFDRRLRTAAIVIAVGGLVAAIAPNSSGILSGAAVNLGLLDPGTVVDILYYMTETTFLGISLQDVAIGIGNAFEYIGVAMAILLLLSVPLGRLLRRREAGS